MFSSHQDKSHKQLNFTTYLIFVRCLLIVGTSGAAKAKIKSDEYQLAAVDIRVCITLRGAYAFLVVYL